MMSQVKDRRRFRRVPRSREIAVFEYGDEREQRAMVRGRLADISAGGASLHSTIAPAVGCIGVVRVQFQGFQLVGECRVVRHWSGGFAVEFTDLESAVRNAVDRLDEEPDAE